MRVGLFYGRPYLTGVPLVGMPFAANIVYWCEASGHDVDVYIAEEPEVSKAELQVSSFVCVRSLNRFYGRLRGWRFRLAAGLAMLSTSYDLVVGVGPIGSHFAAAFARRWRCPLIVCSDELPSSFAGQVGSELGLDAYAKADVIAIPDIARWSKLVEQVPGLAHKPIFELPNIPFRCDAPFVDSVLLDLGLPSDKKLVTFTGGLGGWNQVPEMLASVPTWGEDYVLVMRPFPHRSADCAERRELEHLAHPRVRWIENTDVDDRVVNSLFKRSLCTLGLYRDMGPNVAHVGLSSGKVMRSIACGTPVIVSRVGFGDSMTVAGVGREVSHPLEIGPMLEEVDAKRSQMSQKCEAFAMAHDYTKAWEKVLHFLNKGGSGYSTPGSRH